MTLLVFLGMLSTRVVTRLLIRADPELLVDLKEENGDMSRDFILADLWASANELWEKLEALETLDAADAIPPAMCVMAFFSLSPTPPMPSAMLEGLFAKALASKQCAHVIETCGVTELILV
jgi:hypothetical protein